MQGWIQHRVVGGGGLQAVKCNCLNFDYLHSSLAEEDCHMPIESSQYLIILFLYFLPLYFYYLLFMVGFRQAVHFLNWKFKLCNCFKLLN